MISDKKLNNEEIEKVSGGKFSNEYDGEDIGDLLFTYWNETGDEDGFKKLDGIFTKVENGSKVYSMQEVLVELINEYPPFALYMLKKAKK